MHERIQKIKNVVNKDLNENGELYFFYGVGLVAGIVVTKMVFGQPKVIRPITPATVLNAWLMGVQEAGGGVYILNNAQAELWAKTWAEYISS